MTDVVLCDITDGVAMITLNRPAAMNALDLETVTGLRITVEAVAADDTVRAVVLTGSGRGFCAGQDLKEHVAMLESLPAGDVPGAFAKHVATHYAPIALALATMPKPVIAAVNGIAAGAGASLAFACDYRLASDVAGFNLAFAAIGLSADTGATWTLPRLVGRAKALELLLMPATVGAGEALSLGLVNRVVPAAALAAQAAALAGQLAGGPTVAYGAIKQAVAYSAVNSLADALAFEGEMMARTGGTEDHRGAAGAFVRKEQPTFHAH